MALEWLAALALGVWIGRELPLLLAGWLGT
jgi:hypothetical protein